MNKPERVRQLSDRVLTAMADESNTDVAVVALLDAAVRIVRFTTGKSAAAACEELAQSVQEMGRAERGH